MKQQKAVWEMDMDDFDDEEAGTDDSASEDGELLHSLQRCTIADDEAMTQTTHEDDPQRKR